MINECAKRKISRPTYKYDFSGFVVEFRGNDIANEGVNLVVEIVRKNPGLKASAIANKINKGLSTTERYLKQLRDDNVIEFRGAPKLVGIM